MEEAEDLSEGDISEEEGMAEQSMAQDAAEVKEASTQAAGPVHRSKQYCNSEEYKNLESISSALNVQLVRVPPVLGAGVFRHSSGMFWSCRYSTTSSWFTCSWKSGARSPQECLLKVLKHLVRQHLLHAPPDMASWQAQLSALEEVGR